jgi:hypothetical protein
MAEWKLIAENDDTSTFLETTSIKKQRNKVLVWELINYATPQANVEGLNKSYLSSKNKVLYDCENENLKYLVIIDYSQQMGKGNVVFTTMTASREFQIAPQTISEAAMKAACGKNG